MKLGQLQYVLTEAQINKAIKDLKKKRKKSKTIIWVFDRRIEADTWEELKQKVHDCLVEMYEEEEKDQ